jgi:ATP-binding cassette subfamily C protein
MFTENFSKFIKYYGKGRELRILGFFLLSLLAGVLEFVGIALVYPFILLMISPDTVIKSKYYIQISSFLHIENALTNAFIVGFFVISLFIVKNIFMILTLYLQNKFTNNWKLDLNKKFMKYYLFSPYKNSLKTPPSEKIYNLTSLTSQVIDGFVLRGIALMTNATIVFIILLLLVMKFPLAAVVTSVFIVSSMFLQSKFFKNRTAEISVKLFKTSFLGNSKIIENITNIKEVKILSVEKYFYDENNALQSELAKFSSQIGFYNAIPPYIIEIFIVMSLLILAAILSVQNLQNTSGMVASYAIVVAAIFRIAPALNRIQTSINSMNSSRNFVKSIIDHYEEFNSNDFEIKSDLKLNFENNLKLEGVNFSYTESKPVIKNLNLNIKKGEFLGVIGLSGAGKSTLADIIMGLLPVDSGSIIVDDFDIGEKNFSALRKLIGYVPQQISIFEASFKKNIAWGMNDNEIEDKRVIEVLKMAQLWEFVSGFDEGINASVMAGSTGLSQGQKQRLAIARALYRNPEILIFDEATSALDVEVEYEITKMLTELKGSKTIIAIAHRLSTLKSCDRLIYLKDGEVVDTGTFKQLSERHAGFENLIRLSNLENV